MGDVQAVYVLQRMRYFSELEWRGIDRGSTALRVKAILTSFSLLAFGHASKYRRRSRLSIIP